MNTLILILIFFILTILITILCVMDIVLYITTVTKYGPQGRSWPMSGLYVALFPKKNK